jgi:hypothetical protein
MNLLNNKKYKIEVILQSNKRILHQCEIYNYVWSDYITINNQTYLVVYTVYDYDTEELKLYVK